MKEFKIRINNEFITVNEEIYITYYKMGRRERYLEEVSVEKNLSYNQLVEKDYPIENKMCKPQYLLEDAIIEKIMLEKMMKALDMLTEYERIIIDELFFKGTSIRELSLHLNVPKSTLHEQKEKVIKRLRKIINKI
ncbi:sigma-70 family RNA polymerase sigma factor [Clostridium sp. DJ247]|uniref:sigma-70 family RNA polymerase sigma factor n=1 Tax=Clostridium sp. DJ247 TaxID=2726188 RepID=UPI001624B8A3|nr:sigma-70 family RNA polymerase sigma factor [Clostridium sp. DJ247]MBC2579353.1 sigma-70 family RNA polymerase sigma factor [Clostridium sp. DJ247]